MNLIDMFYTEIEDCKARKVPLIIPIGTWNTMRSTRVWAATPW